MLGPQLDASRVIIFLKQFYFIEVQLTYSIVLVSAVQQDESIISIPAPPPCQASLPPSPSHPSRSSRSVRLSCLCYAAASR